LDTICSHMRNPVDESRRRVRGKRALIMTVSFSHNFNYKGVVRSVWRQCASSFLLQIVSPRGRAGTRFYCEMTVP
jgi:hypothetical protein